MEQKTAIVTGANRGLGLHIAKALNEKGMKVFLFCRDVYAGERVRGTFAFPELAEVVDADLADVKTIDIAYSYVASKVGSVDVLVNNAAISVDGDATIETITLEKYRQTMDTNVLGLLWMCKRFLPLIRKATDGRIINFSSGLGMLSVPRMGALPLYSISKTAVNAITTNLAEEERETSVTVVSVDPGWVKTDLGGPDAELEIADGIDTPVWLATADLCDIESGKFYKERNVLPW